MWKKNYRITEVNYVNNKWVLIMTKGEKFGKKQAWNKDEKFPVDWVNNKYEQNLKVTNVTYGEGEWELESAGWDVKEEVESLGMKDYKKDKGFSTDAYFVVNGELDEVSLKKDLKANLLNATTGRVIDLVIFG